MKRYGLVLALLMFGLAAMVGCGDENLKPNIKSIDIEVRADGIYLTALADDPNGDELTYIWKGDNVSFPGGNDGQTVMIEVSDSAVEFQVELAVSDGRVIITEEKKFDLGDLGSSDQYCQLSLTVTDSDGMPVNNVALNFAGVSLGKTYTRLTNQAGIVLTKVAKDTYQVTFASPGFEGVKAVYIDCTSNQASRLIVLGSTVTGETLIVNGTVVRYDGKGLPGMTVTAMGSGYQKTMMTDDMGDFRFADVPAGKLTLHVHGGYEDRVMTIDAHANEGECDGCSNVVIYVKQEYELPTYACNCESVGYFGIDDTYYEECSNYDYYMSYGNSSSDLCGAGFGSNCFAFEVPSPHLFADMIDKASIKFKEGAPPVYTDPMLDDLGCEHSMRCFTFVNGVKEDEFYFFGANQSVCKETLDVTNFNIGDDVLVKCFGYDVDKCISVVLEDVYVNVVM